MTLYEQIIETYPELSDNKLFDANIVLQNDSDGTGDYIRVWNYIKPMTAELEEYYRG